MNEKKRIRVRFSIKTLLAIVTITAVGLGGWIGYSKCKIQELVELRQQGAIVILRNRTPKPLQSIGIKHLSPFFDVPTVELYITPVGSDAEVGNSERLISRSKAEALILEQATIARSCGAEDIQLILIDAFVSEWMVFARKNSFSVIGDSKQRYMKRLKANQESGANINP